jgi:hypothetical protein
MNIRYQARSFALSGLAATRGIVPTVLAAKVLGRMHTSLIPPDPEVEYPGSRKAACCVSIDFDVTRPDRWVTNHAGTEALIFLASEYGIPITWALCGKTVQGDPEAFHTILDSGVSHEIAAHTFAHMPVDEASPHEVEEDFQMWRAAVGGEARPKTFVFPFNREGNFEALSRLGFTAYRVARQIIGSPLLQNGFWNVPPVYYFSGKGQDSGAMKLVDLCIGYHSVFHLWAHPWNFARAGDPRRTATQAIEPWFSYLRKKCDEGALGLCTIGELAAASESSNARRNPPRGLLAMRPEN